MLIPNTAAAQSIPLYMSEFRHADIAVSAERRLPDPRSVKNREALPGDHARTHQTEENITYTHTSREDGVVDSWLRCAMFKYFLLSSEFAFDIVTGDTISAAMLMLLLHEAGRQAERREAARSGSARASRPSCRCR